MGKVVSFSKWVFIDCLVDIYIYIYIYVYILRKLWGERETLDLNLPFMHTKWTLKEEDVTSFPLDAV